MLLRYSILFNKHEEEHRMHRNFTEDTEVFVIFVPEFFCDFCALSALSVFL
jgi:hypothetical protein